LPASEPATPSAPKKTSRRATSDTPPDAYYQIPLTTSEAKATLAALTALCAALAADTDEDAPLFEDFDPEILDSAAESIAEQLPEFALPQVDRLAKQLTAWLSPRPEPEPAPFGRHGDEEPPFPTERNRRRLERALDRGLPAEIEYYVRSREEWTVRRVDIEDVFEDEGSWYLEGYCRLRRDHRLFRLDNIRAVRIPGEDSPNDKDTDDAGDEEDWDPFSEENAEPPPTMVRTTPPPRKRGRQRG
jgi:hypothetical protein